MSSIKDQYAELLTLTRQYLLQNYEAKATKATDLESFTFFKRSAQQQREQSAKNPQVPPPSISSTQKTVQPPQIITSSQAPVAINQELPKQHPSSIPPVKQPQSQQQNILAPQQVVQPDKKRAAPLPFSNTTTATEKVVIVDKKPIETVSEDSKALFRLDPLPPATMIDFHDIRQIVVERFPSQKIVDEIPCDDAAKRKVSNSVGSSAEVLILSFTQDPKEQVFLSNIARAITLLLKLNVEVINAAHGERTVDWNKELNEGPLKLVIANREHINALPKLIEHYREERNESDHANEPKCYLGKTSLCLLSEISLYFKDPKQKAALWKSIYKLFNKND